MTAATTIERVKNIVKSDVMGLSKLMFVSQVYIFAVSCNPFIDVFVKTIRTI